MTVYENMAFGLKVHKTRQQNQRRVRKAADILEIGHLLDRSRRHCQADRKQRVAIGSVIVRKLRPI